MPGSDRTRPPQSEGSLLRSKVFVGSLAFVVLGIAALIAVVFITRGGSNARLKLAAPLGGSIELTSTQELTVSSRQVETFDTGTYFVSSELKLAFKKPEVPSEWSAVKSYDGLPPELASYVACFVERSPEQLPPLLSRTLVQTTGPPLRVTLTPQTTIDVYGTEVPSGAPRSCDLSFRNGIFVEVFPRARVKEAIGTDLSLPAFVSFLIAQFGIRLDTLAANPSQILGTWTFRAHRARLEGKEDDFTEYRAFSFTQTRENFYVAEITFSPDATSPPDRWIEMQRMLESFRLISG